MSSETLISGMPKVAEEEWQLHGVSVPVHIYVERRNGNRVAINKDKVIIRLPRLRAKLTYTRSLNWAKEWLIDQTSAKPELLDRFKVFSYQDGHTFRTAYHSYQLGLQLIDGDKCTARLLKDNVISCKVPKAVSDRERSKLIQKVAARIIAKHTTAAVTDRIHQLNAQHFQQTVNNVRIKNTKSNWGSCSNNGNINISVRTLFAPLDVQDYVFVHELAHLIELNHSSRYWNLVHRAMPDYRIKEQWLNEHGSTDFFRL